MSARTWFDRVPHDLRGPLSSLQTAAYLLRSDPEGANARELAGIVVRQSQRLGRMIEELDDCVRAEQHRLVDQREPLELPHLIDMALTGVPDCGIEPEYADDAKELQVLGDGSRLAQLLRTLVAQSLGRDPGARMLVARAGTQASITLVDQGPPLAAEACDRLLQGSQHPPPDEGLGLRLLIARAIAEAHGGSLQADSGDGAGLRLRCVLPLAG